MGLAAPAALAASALLGAVALLWMLRLRRDDRPVPSILLWSALAQDPPSNQPWQPLRRSLLLALQLAFLGCMVLALARPFVSSGEAVGPVLIALLDRSASMAATDVEPSRLEAAKVRLIDMVSESGGTRVTVVAFDARGMEVVVSAAADVQAVRDGLDRVEPVPVAGDPSDALAFAAALAEGQPGAEIRLFTDGNLTPSGEATLNGVRVELVGVSSANQAVGSVGISEAGPGADAELFARIDNHAPQPVTRRVETHVDGALYDVRDILMAPLGEAGFTLVLPPNASRAQVSLQGSDALPLDDNAWAVRSAARTVRVTLVSAGNRFLATALSLLPFGGGVTEVGADAAEGPYGLTDVAVLDGILPSRLPPGNLILIRPPGPTGSIRIAGELEQPVPVVMRSESAILASTDLSKMSVLRSAALELGADWLPLVVAEVDGKHWPLIAEGAVEGRRTVVFAFDLRESDLPLQSDFPVLMANIVAYLAPPTLAGVPLNATPGDPLRLRFAAGVTVARIEPPQGGPQVLRVERGEATLADVTQLGIWRVAAEGPEGEPLEALVAVNLEAIEESDVRPRDVGAAARPDVEGTEQIVQGRRELWRWAALLALVALCGEWIWFHRLAASDVLGALRSADAARRSPSR